MVMQHHTLDPASLRTAALRRGAMGEHVSIPNCLIYTCNILQLWNQYPTWKECVDATAGPTLHSQVMAFGSVLDFLEMALECNQTPCPTLKYLKTLRQEEKRIAQLIFDKKQATEVCTSKNQCAQCGKTESAPLAQGNTIQLKLCSGCKSIFFCGANCQKLGWPTHKKKCKDIQAQNGRHGGRSKARALQVLKQLEEVKDQPWNLGRGKVYNDVHEMCDYKNKKVMKWAVKNGLIHMYRNIITVRDIQQIRADCAGFNYLNAGNVVQLQHAVLRRHCQNGVSLLDLLLVSTKVPNPPGDPPTPDLQRMQLFLTNEDGTQNATGFWNLMEIAYIYYRVPNEAIEIQSRFLVRQFAKIFAVAEVAALVIPSLTKKNCQLLTWLGTSFDYNPFDRSAAMQYLAMQIIANLTCQIKKQHLLVPKGYNKKWLMTGKLKKELIYTDLVLPSCVFACKNNRMIVHEEFMVFQNKFMRKR